MDVPLNCDMLKRLPLIVVLGATGTGKSKLAIQLARIFNGEVISADSMQLYQGLDIVTNKVTEEETEGVPHHCLNFLDPLSSYTVVDFRDRALPIVERLLKEGKLPVVVGGTHYYIESLLWKVLVRDGETIAECKEAGPMSNLLKLSVFLEELEYTLSVAMDNFGPEEMDKVKHILGVTEKTEILEAIRNMVEKTKTMSEEDASELLVQSEPIVALIDAFHPNPVRMKNRRLHARLREVDPERAERLHFNDVRKVKRSLEIYEKCQRSHSDILRLQREEEGGSELGGPLRFQDTAIFWIGADQDVLDKRLDDRVDEMISRGLVKELEDFHKEYNESRIKDTSSLPYTQGIFQSIGFKEFHNYLILPDKTCDEAAQYLKNGIEMMKIATRRYARKQIKWIKGRVLKTKDRQVPPVYYLDATNPKDWDEKVLTPAMTVVRSFTEGPQDDMPQPLPTSKATGLRPLKGEHICRTCMRIFVGDHQWEEHLKSKKHHAMVKKKQKQKDLLNLSS